MALLKDATKEARRVGAVRAALHRDRRWELGAFYGNVSAAGLRKRGQNSTRTGADSLAVKLASAYCAAVTEASSGHAGLGKSTKT